MISLADSRQRVRYRARDCRSAAVPLFVEPFYIDGQELRPTIRSGLAFYPHDAKTADALVQNAEAALKAAREDNEKYMMYGLVTQRPTSRSLALEARLTRALEHEEFLLQYQPKVDIKSGKSPRSRSAAALAGFRGRHHSAVGFHSAAGAVRRHRRRRRMGHSRRRPRDIRKWHGIGLAQHTRRSECLASAIAAPGLRRSGTGRHRTHGLEHRGLGYRDHRKHVDARLGIVDPQALRSCARPVSASQSTISAPAIPRCDSWPKLPVDTLKIDKSFVQSIAGHAQCRDPGCDHRIAGARVQHEDRSRGRGNGRATAEIAADEVRPGTGIPVQPTGIRVGRAIVISRLERAQFQPCMPFQSCRFRPVDFHFRRYDKIAGVRMECGYEIST